MQVEFNQYGQMECKGAHSVPFGGLLRCTPSSAVDEFWRYFPNDKQQMANKEFGKLEERFYAAELIKKS